MKRLFLLIPVLVFSLLANATKTTINNSTDDALRLALYYSTAGDTIVMNAGTYEESNSDYIAWRRSNVVMAAEGATVIIKPHVSFRVRNGARAELIGVKIDASEIGTYNNIFEAHDANDGNRLILQNCEIYGNPNRAIVHWASDKKLDSLIIDNCYIHDNAQVSLRLETASLKGVTITNSTFANMANGGDFWAAPIDIKNTASDAKVIVDHCTFYHNTSISSSYADVTTGVDGSATSDVTITNCIFAQPASYDGSRAINLVNGGTVRNCLTFNYTKSTNGIQGATVKENCIAADPLFNDLANNKYTFNNNWVTMSISPACGAATDGSHLGDPRWHSAETLPSTSFASAYDLLGTKAMLSGRIELNASNKIHFKHNADVADGTAKWKLHVGRACIVSALADVETNCTSGRQLTLTVKDADGNTVATLAQPSATYNDADINLGQIAFSEEGDYTFILTNSLVNSGVVLEKITLSYIGGAVQDMPGTTAIADAWFSSGGTRADSKIDFPDGYIQDGWVKWNVAFASAGNYNVTVNIDNVNGHNYTVALYRSESDESPITIGEGSQKSTKGTIELGAMEVPAGNYIMKVTNATQHSDAKLVSVQFTYAGGATIDVPTTLLPVDAILSSEAWIDNDSILFTARGSEGHNTDNWAKWKISVANRGLYDFTAHVCRKNGGQKYEIKVLNSDESSEIFTYTDESISAGDKTTSTGARELAAGNYVVRVRNIYNHAESRLLKVVVERGTIAIDEEDDSEDDVINPNNGLAVNVQLKRSLTAGMYNTICLPFAVSASEMARVFPGAIVKELTSSSIDEGEFVLNLNFDAVSEMEAGVPYLIKPASNISNPKFLGVTIVNSLRDAETNNADFIGNFVVDQIPASENNLFLGADNTLYFPTVNVEIQGLRAYFKVKNSSGAPIRRARIVEKNNVATEIEIVQPDVLDKTEKSNVVKRIEDGQLLIIRDGVQYNTLGVRVK